MYWKLRKCTRCRPSLLLSSSLRLFIELLIGHFKGALSRLASLFILFMILILKTYSFAMQIKKLLVNDDITARRVKQVFPKH